MLSLCYLGMVTMYDIDGNPGDKVIASISSSSPISGYPISIYLFSTTPSHKYYLNPFLCFTDTFSLIILDEI